MSVVVVPFGVLAALYLREYAQAGRCSCASVRIAVNNLAGVPSIVFGVFGLGFFVYFVGGTHRPALLSRGAADADLRHRRHPVGVADPGAADRAGGDRGHRGGAGRGAALDARGLAGLGATKFETIWRVVLPAAAPGILTGMILAMARAAGEVAPLMIVGRGQARAGAAGRRQLPVRPPRAQVHAPGLPHLRRRLPEPQRRGREAAWSTPPRCC